MTRDGICCPPLRAVIALKKVYQNSEQRGRKNRPELCARDGIRSRTSAAVIALQKVYPYSGQRGRKYPASGKTRDGIRRGAFPAVIALQKVYPYSGQRGRKNPASDKPETGFGGAVAPGGPGEDRTPDLRVAKAILTFCNLCQFSGIWLNRAIFLGYII